MGFDSQKVKASKMVQWIKLLSWVFNSQFMHFQLIKWICARIEPFRETIAFIQNRAVSSSLSSIWSAQIEWVFLNGMKKKIAREQQNLNIASSKTATVYSYLNTFDVNYAVLPILSLSRSSGLSPSLSPSKRNNHKHTLFFYQIKALDNLR